MDKLTPEQEERVTEVAQKMRELLFSLPEELHMEVLSHMEICLHCAGDESTRPPGSMPCQCWNDE